MRRLKSHTEAEALQELRSDEVLVPSGGVTIQGSRYHDYLLGEP